VELAEAARVALAGATEGGADAADALAVERRETTLKVRRAELESSKEAETRGVGVRAFRGGRLGIAYTTDLSPEGLRRAGRQAAELAELAGVDDASGLPAAEHRAGGDGVEGIDDPAFEAFDPAAATALALEAEKAAFDEDARVTNSEGASFMAVRSAVALAASDGFSGSYRKTRFGLHVSVVAEGEDGILQRDGWYTSSTRMDALEAAASVGRTAAHRCVRKLGWRKVPTCEVPVVLSPEVAASIAGHLARAASGDALHRRASWLTESLGKTVASAAFSLVDDPLREGGLGSRPFDAEGGRARRKAVVEKGVLRTFLLDSYSLRKLGASAGEGAVPGNAVRGLGGSTGVGCSNLCIEPGERPPESVIGEVKDGFYVTETMGFGINVTTGDVSQGAAGLWIRDGRLDGAVQEVTIASDFPTLLAGVEEVGNDLLWNGEVSAPTVYGLLVGGGRGFPRPPPVSGFSTSCGSRSTPCASGATLPARP